MTSTSTHKNNPFLLINLLIVFFIPVTICFTEGSDHLCWPGWRGPFGNGTCAESNWDPQKINKKVDILWEKNIGKGYSNVSIKDNLLYITGNINKKDTVYCLDFNTGKTLWSYSYDCPTQGYYPGTRASPFIDKNYVFTASREGHIFCFQKTTGRVIWKKHAVIDLKAEDTTWGFSSSPIIHNDILLMNVRKYGIALNKKTGEIVWMSPEGKCGYASPVICTIEGTRQVLFFGFNAIYSTDINTGQMLWSYPWATEWGANTADPLVMGDRVFISSNYKMGCVCLKIKTGKPIVLWHNKEMNSIFPSFIFNNDYIYGNDGTAGKGFYKCIDARTGKVMWSKKLGFGTLSSTGNNLIFLTELGHLAVIDMNPHQYTELSRTRIKGGIFFTEPVLVKGRIFLRRRDGPLFCIDVQNSL